MNKVFRNSLLTLLYSFVFVLALANLFIIGEIKSLILFLIVAFIEGYLAISTLLGVVAMVEEAEKTENTKNDQV